MHCGVIKHMYNKLNVTQRMDFMTSYSPSVLSQLNGIWIWPHDERRHLTLIQSAWHTGGNSAADEHPHSGEQRPER